MPAQRKTIPSQESKDFSFECEIEDDDDVAFIVRNKDCIWEGEDEDYNIGSDDDESDISDDSEMDSDTDGDLECDE